MPPFGFPGGLGPGGSVDSVVAGQDVAVDSSDPAAPVVSVGPKRGADLTDADQTLQPFSDKASEYRQAAALTGNRQKILGITSAFEGAFVTIKRTDAAAFTLAVLNGGVSLGTLFTFTASPTGPQSISAYFNGVDWVLVGFQYEHTTA